MISSKQYVDLVDSAVQRLGFTHGRTPTNVYFQPDAFGFCVCFNIAVNGWGLPCSVMERDIAKLGSDMAVKKAITTAVKNAKPADMTAPLDFPPNKKEQKAQAKAALKTIKAKAHALTRSNR